MQQLVFPLFRLGLNLSTCAGPNLVVFNQFSESRKQQNTQTTNHSLQFITKGRLAKLCLCCCCKWKIGESPAAQRPIRVSENVVPPGHVIGVPKPVYLGFPHLNFDCATIRKILGLQTWKFQNTYFVIVFAFGLVAATSQLPSLSHQAASHFNPLNPYCPPAKEFQIRCGTPVVLFYRFVEECG